jgi:hypothetical protein
MLAFFLWHAGMFMIRTTCEKNTRIAHFVWGYIVFLFVESFPEPGYEANDANGIVNVVY